jgi:hypothetical protein
MGKRRDESSARQAQVPALPSPDVLGEPAGEETGDLEIVFLEHHHVAVAVDTDIGQLYPRRMDANLFEIFGSIRDIRQ